MNPLQAQAVTYKAGNTGIMVAFFLPPTLAEGLATMVAAAPLPDGTETLPEAELHLTLAFCGDMAEADFGEAALAYAVAEFAGQSKAIAGRIGGVGRFNAQEAGAAEPLYASFDAPELPVWREQLVHFLKDRGFRVDETHGFTPHITLAYAPAGTANTLPQLPTLDVVFPALSLAWGERRYDFPLGGVWAVAGAQLKAPNYGARAGETIAGNLKRGASGKFESAGKKRETAPRARRQRLGRTAARRAAEREARRAARRTGGAKRGQNDAERKRREAEREAKRQQREQAAEAKRQQREAAAEQKRQAREAERAKRAAEREARRASGGGKGGGKGPKPTAEEAAAERRRAKRQQVRDAVAGAGLDGKTFDALMAFGDGEEVAPEALAELAKVGLAERDESGGYRLTVEGRRVVSAANSGNARGASDALSRARDGAAGEGGKRRLGGAGGTGGVAVVKDARGRWRWIAFSSTAFRDRDGEIVSTKALAEDCARADGDGEYGPLRWWHVPGAELGDCDWNAMSGRVLVESGTFRDERIGAAVAEKVAELGISIGFLHPSQEPDAGRVFNSIRRFERSLAPAGRVSNLFTRLLVQREEGAVVKEKFEALLGLLGGNRALAEAVVSQAEATEKAADAAGVAFKAESDGAGEADEAVADAGEGAEAEADAAEDDEAEGDGEGTLYVGDMTPTEFAEMMGGVLATAMQTAMAPLTDALNIETKLRGVVDEVKGIAAGMATKKDDEAARLKEQEDRVAQLATELAAAQAALKELAGEQPRGTQRAGYRASADDGTVVQDGHRLKGQQPEPDPLEAFVSGFVVGGNGAAPQ